MKSEIKLLILGIIINLLLVLLFVYKMTTIEIFINTTVDIKIISIFIYIIYYMFLLNCNNNNFNKKFININTVNCFIKIIIALGCFNLCIMPTSLSSIRYALTLIFIIVVSFGLFLLYLILLAIDNNYILGIFQLMFIVILSISDIIIFIFLLIIITNIYKKEKMEKILSIIYFPAIYYMLLSGVEFIKNIFFN